MICEVCGTFRAAFSGRLFLFPDRRPGLGARLAHNSELTFRSPCRNLSRLSVPALTHPLART